MCRAWGGLAIAAALLAAVPDDVAAQVFVATSPRPDISIGPLFVGAIAPSDPAAPVSVTVTWNLAQRRGARPYAQTLALLWPAEIAAPTAQGGADPALVNYVESRGFTSTGSGRLVLRARSQSQLGLPTPADDLPASASYVSFVRRDAPPQAGTGALVWIPPTPQLGDQRWVLSLTFPVRGLITPRPATWLEDVFWGRRNTLALSWGDVGSIAFYPMYHEHRDRIVHLAREYSRLLASFPDADHLRIEDIEPAARRHRDRLVAAEHRRRRAADAEGALRVLSRGLRVAAGADLARPADPRQPDWPPDGERPPLDADARAPARGAARAGARGNDDHAGAAGRDPARRVDLRRRRTARRPAGRAALSRRGRRAAHARVPRDATPPRARAPCRLAHHGASLGHRALRGGDRAGRRARMRHRHPRAPRAGELAGLSHRAPSRAWLRSPLAPWLSGAGATRRFRRRVLGRRIALLRPRDDAWPALAPPFAGAVALAR